MAFVKVTKTNRLVIKTAKAINTATIYFYEYLTKHVIAHNVCFFTDYLHAS